ncbi:hypothetical protein GCM10011491_45890 [Brucella endophytica]|uniref:Uncharacterized protein n=1 Tax=Brucella endophytica TaxID=1963359 RepID=A0A916SQT3_9HYPH|nr:hypothetical protein [Brucella endophytica]GGB12953.1 hypothetical protein GCM10011491_45890 [Brucella endophytica]
MTMLTALSSGETCSLDGNRNAPKFPQADVYGVIYVNELAATQWIIVNVGPYTSPAPGDVLKAYFGSMMAGKLPITTQNVAGPYWVLCNPAHIPNGTYSVYDTITDSDGNCTTSPTASVTIAGSTASGAPGPEFPDAINGILPYQVLSDQGYATIRARYGIIAVNDQVEFHWTGTNSLGFSVPGAKWDSQKLPVNQKDKDQGYIETQIPFDNIKVLGDLGTGTGTYTVYPQAGGAPIDSLPTEVLLSFADVKSVQVSASQYAPTLVPPPPALWAPFAYNWVSVFGAPGTTVRVYVTDGLSIVDAQGAKEYHPQLDQNGMAKFMVQSSVSSGIVYAYLPGSTDRFTPHAYLTYYTDPIDSQQEIIQGYNYTSGAPADNATFNMIYVLVDTSHASKKLTVNITNSSTATINGEYNPKVDVPLSSDGTAVIRIFDTIPESVNVTLHIEGDAQNEPLALPPITFVEFPKPHGTQ